MSTDTQRAADAVRNILHKFRDLPVLAEALDRIGSIEQAERDAEIRKDQAYAAADEAGAKLDVINADIVQAKRGLEQASASAREVRDAADSAAREIRAEAKKEAAQLVSDASAKTEGIDMLCNERQKALAAIEKHVETKQAELAALQKKIDEMKEQVRKAFSG